MPAGRHAKRRAIPAYCDDAASPQASETLLGNRIRMSKPTLRCPKSPIGLEPTTHRLWACTGRSNQKRRRNAAFLIS